MLSTKEYIINNFKFCNIISLPVKIKKGEELNLLSLNNDIGSNFYKSNLLVPKGLEEYEKNIQFLLNTIKIIFKSSKANKNILQKCSIINISTNNCVLQSDITYELNKAILPRTFKQQKGGNFLPKLIILNPEEQCEIIMETTRNIELVPIKGENTVLIIIVTGDIITTSKEVYNIGMEIWKSQQLV